MSFPPHRWLFVSLSLVVTPAAVAAPINPPCPAGTPLLRLTTPAYDDGISSPRGEISGLPSARFISNVVCSQPASYPSRKALAAMIFQWGQFIDHDITLVHGGGDFFPIVVPSGDPEFDPFALGTQLIPITPLDNANENPSLDPEDLFISGDIRCNEQSGLLAMHTLFLREHNRLARQIKAASSELTDEEIFQQAKRQLVAFLQVITYQEFLPAVLGEDALPIFTAYQSGTDPCISNEFSTAAFRVGHSMLPAIMPRMDASLHEHSAGHLSLAASYFVPAEVANMGITPYFRGLACIPLEANDQMVVDEVRNMLFGPPGAGGLDLAAINIQRGRDHGLGSYNQVRTELGLSAATSFSDITSDTDVQSALSTAYAAEIDDIDLWVGGMIEDHLPGAILGETFHRIWVDQFQRLRDGDPNWFENTDAACHPNPFTPNELAEIRETTLARIIARNTDWNAAESLSVFELPAPRILSFTPEPSSGQITLEWTSFVNAPYQIEACNDLGQPSSFESVMSETRGGGATTTVTFTDSDAIAEPRRFFRIIQR